MARAGTLLQVHPTSITNAVSRLEKAGLVRREPHPSDGRAVLIQITGPGRELTAEATKHINATLFTQAGLSPQRLRMLFSVIRDLRREAGDFA
jgi:DNA-binding MarR family transcriptional regulator